MGGLITAAACRFDLPLWNESSTRCTALTPVYRPHVDGAWPGSGFSEGKVLFDAFGDRWSRLTFLLYLNDGFEGGATTFYTPGEQEG